MPLIWHAIDKTKITTEMRRVLKREWEKLKVDVNIQVYNIWFSNTLCDAVRKLELVMMGEETFLMSEDSLSPINYPPRTHEEIEIFNKDMKHCERT